MINLERYNARSPYKATHAATEGFYEFTTDYGVIYSVGFMADDSIISQNAYQFIITNANNRPSPKDEKVKEAIIVMIDEFFNTDKNVLLYICETGDGKQAMRNRLFQYWFSQYEKKEEYTFLSSSVIDEEGVVNYATIIVKNSNPYLADAVREFTETIQMFNRKPWVYPYEGLSELSS